MQRDEGESPALLIEAVDPLRKHLLARAGLPFEQHRDVADLGSLARPKEDGQHQWRTGDKSQLVKRLLQFQAQALVNHAGTPIVAEPPTVLLSPNGYG